MARPDITLAFFKLNVPEMEPALDFWREAFGFGPVQVAMLRSPQGHEIELVQLPGEALS